MASVAAGYLPILLFLAVALALSGAFVVLPMIVSRLTGTHKPDAEKLSEYECGFPAFDDSRAQFLKEARAAAQVTLAEIELKRIQDMPAGASVPIELQRVEAALAEARAVLAGAKAAVESARLLVEWCRVTAPISGRIGERLVDPGNLITGGIGTATLPLLWAALHASKVVFSLVGGHLSDRIGRKRLIVCGWVLYAAVYAGFAFASSAATVWALFLVYGVYFGLAEGAEKALVADLVRPEQRGTAFGLFGLITGLAALLASVLAGVLWEAVGPEATFLAGAAFAGLALIGFVAAHRRLT